MVDSILPASRAIARVPFTPFKLLATGLQRIVEANQFVREVEMVSHYDDERLRSLGLRRTSLVRDLAERADLFAH